MKRQIFLKALTLGVAGTALVLSGCETVENRISEHQDIYNSLSPNDQALVSQGKIRYNMSKSAVWLAWGSAEQKTTGNMRGHDTETWIYVQSRTASYPYGPYGYGYGYGYGYPYGGFGGGVGVIRTHHHGRAFAFYGDPFYDPFFYSYIPPTISYPYKTVTFSNGRVLSFQYLVPQ